MAETYSPGRTSAGIYQFAPSPLPWPDRPINTDALADPSLDTIAETLPELLPYGVAWRTPDGAAFDWNSRLGGFLRSLAGDLATLYRRLFAVTQESTAATFAESLDDWEAEFDLPDQCFGEDQTRAQRIRALLLKVRSKGTITRADFVMLAASVGYTITIEEPRPFAFGTSYCGGDDETSGVNQFIWVVRVPERAFQQFEFGISETGIDSLLDIALATDLECLFRALAPAWTRVIFDYS